MEERGLPVELRNMIGSEEIDFEVKAAHAKPLRSAWFFILFGAAWTAFSMIFVIAFLGPLFLGQEVHFESNGVPTTASPDNLSPIILPAIIIGIFVLIGIIFMAWGTASLFVRGGYFIGTTTRLISFNNGKLRSIDWEQFSGDIEVNGTQEKGNLSLRMRTGSMVSRKNAPSEYVPEVINLVGIKDVYDIERICRQRIKENDPTPPQISEIS
jgi:hypothetical protein